MTSREELLKSKEYWLVEFQTRLFNIIHDYMDQKGLTQSDFAKQLGYSKGYVSQVLSGDFNGRISKLIELALAADKAPVLQFEELDKLIEEDQSGVDIHDSYRPEIKLNITFGATLDQDIIHTTPETESLKGRSSNIKSSVKLSSEPSEIY
jgi:transcriptional regulator with XRE-family HTH domain